MIKYDIWKDAIPYDAMRYGLDLYIDNHNGGSVDWSKQTPSNFVNMGHVETTWYIPTTDINIDEFVCIDLDKRTYVSMAAGWWINYSLIPNAEGSNTIDGILAWIYGFIY